MSDLHAGWNGDFASSETGDLATVSRPSLGTERVLRRLLTNPRSYVWHPSYGAGLARFVGQPIAVAEIQALIRSQMLLEAAVARDPEPVITVQPDSAGSLFVQIRYADAETAQSQTVNIELPRS